MPQISFKKANLCKLDDSVIVKYDRLILFMNIDSKKCLQHYGHRRQHRYSCIMQAQRPAVGIHPRSRITKLLDTDSEVGKKLGNRKELMTIEKR